MVYSPNDAEARRTFEIRYREQRLIKMPCERIDRHLASHQWGEGQDGSLQIPIADVVEVPSRWSPRAWTAKGRAAWESEVIETACAIKRAYEEKGWDVEVVLKPEDGSAAHLRFSIRPSVIDPEPKLRPAPVNPNAPDPRKNPEGRSMSSFSIL